MKKLGTGSICGVTDFTHANKAQWTSDTFRENYKWQLWSEYNGKTDKDRHTNELRDEIAKVTAQGLHPEVLGRGANPNFQGKSQREHLKRKDKRQEAAAARAGKGLSLIHI